MLVFLLGLQYANTHNVSLMIDRETILVDTSIMINEEYQPDGKRVDYRDELNPWSIYQQGECGNCYAVGVTTALQATAQMRQNLTEIISPGYITAHLSYSSAYYNFLGCNGGALVSVPYVMTGENINVSVCNEEEKTLAHPSYCGIGERKPFEFCCADNIKTPWTNDGLETCTEARPQGCSESWCSIEPKYEDCKISQDYLSQGTLNFRKLNASFFSHQDDCTPGSSTDSKRNCAQLMTYLLHEFGPIAVAVGVYPDDGSVTAQGTAGWYTIDSSNADMSELCFDYRGKYYENHLNHVVTIVGDRTHNGEAQWIVQNSWGTNWGDNGYFYVNKGQNLCGIESEFVAWNEIHIEGNPETFAPTVNLTFAKAFADSWPQNRKVWPAPAPTPTKGSSNTKWYHYAAIAVGGAIVVGIVFWAFKPSHHSKRKMITADDDSLTLTPASAGEPRKLRL